MTYAIVSDGVIETLFLEAPPPHAQEVPKDALPGWRMQSDGSFSPPAPDLHAARAVAMRRIELAASRSRDLTPGAPYKEKHEQALEVSRMLDDGEAVDDLPHEAQVKMFPHLMASVGIETQTLSETARVILERYTQSANEDYLIERARLSGRTGVKRATSLAEVEAASMESIQALEAVRNERSSGLAEGQGAADE